MPPRRSNRAAKNVDAEEVPYVAEEAEEIQVEDGYEGPEVRPRLTLNRISRQLP